jgi:hypothetical protein
MHKNAEQTEDLLNELIDKIPFETSTNKLLRRLLI